jgi:molecular chaperone GrpE (heat shock protein)
MSEEKKDKPVEKQAYYWNGVGTYGHSPGIAKGEKLPDAFADPRLEGWLKDGTVTTSEPDMSAQLKDEAELLRIEIAELEEKNAALKGISKKLVEADADIVKFKKRIEQLENALSALNQNTIKVVREVCQKLGDDSMSRKEKDDAAKLLKGLINE